MHALVIDDAKTMRMLLRRMLGALGFEVAEAADGAEGLRELRRLSHIDLVLVDCNMPGLDGFAFVQAVRAEKGFDAIRLLMVTAEEDKALLDRAMRAGADAYLVKPFTREGILEQLKRLGLCLPLSA